jgi:2,4-diaminopentanoate dehydrogenase
MADSQQIPCVVMGLGYIGLQIAEAATCAPGLTLVGVVDPAHAGETLAQLIETLPKDHPASKLEVKSDLAEVARLAKGGVVFHATGSYLHQVDKQLEACLRARLNVVSTCEELAYPWLSHRSQADMLHRQALDFGVRMVGTGVNPGFVFERLGAMLSQVSGPVRAVKGVRVVDTSTRRHALQVKTGAGLSEKEFRSRVENGGFGHVGLKESAVLLAKGCGIDLPFKISEDILPVIAERAIEGTVSVKAGDVAGIHQIVRAQNQGRDVVTLDLTIAMGASDPRDEITLETDPPLRLLVTGGTPGDSATAWAAIHAASQIVRLPPGLKTVLDLPAGRAPL